jgi:hypothetical protein
MKIAVVALSLVLFFTACRPEKQCPPCSDCNAKITYQISKTGSDTLSITYCKVDTAWYEGCTLRGGFRYLDTVYTTPGNYELKVKGFITGDAAIQGYCREKGWTLKILSSNGAVLASTENKAYGTYLNARNQTIYTNGLIIEFQ